MSDTIFIGSANLLVSVIESLGIEPQPFIQQALGRDVDLNLRFDPDARVEYRELEKVWIKIFDQAQDECLGVRASNLWHPSYLGALGYAWLSSASLIDGFQRIERYLHMISRRLQFRLSQTDTETIVVFSRETIQQELYFLTDGMMAVFLNMCRANTHPQFCPIAADFTRPAPGCAEEFRQFFGCPVTFNAENNRLLFSRQAIEQPLSGSNPFIADASDRIVIDYLARMDDTNIVDQVKSEIIHQLPSGKATENLIAEALNLSSRSLQRALNEAGTSFSAILNEVREDLALKYIKDSSLTLTEIAFMLGFSESSSFTRAFKRWTGSAPSHLRSH